MPVMAGGFLFIAQGQKLYRAFGKDINFQYHMTSIGYLY